MVAISENTGANADLAKNAEIGELKVRAEVLNYALYANNLLEPAYYKMVEKALLAENISEGKALFKEVCRAAKIPDDYADDLYEIFKAGPKINRMW